MSNTSFTSDLQKKLSTVDLTGFWIAKYGAHGLEMVEISAREDGILVARKITGDEHVPGGEVTFEVDLKKGGKGRIQIAEKGFKNPEWASGSITSLDSHDQFVFEWANIRRPFTRVKITPPRYTSDSSSLYLFEGDSAIYRPRN